jgi:hypothetical protein
MDASTVAIAARMIRGTSVASCATLPFP